MESLFNSTRNLGVFIGVGVLSLVVIGVLLRILQGWRNAGTSKNWIAITGTVLSANVVAGRNRGRNGVSYYPVVMYEYSVDGNRYVGNRMSFGSQIGVGFQAVAARSLGKYPVGGTVPVYYNPNNPAEAVLERSAPGNWGNIFLLAILLIAIFVLLTSFGILKLPIGG
jgi:hypothetical protein